MAGVVVESYAIVSQAENGGQQSGPCEDRKLFVGGFPLSTTEADLRNNFNRFGDIESIQIKTDAVTGRSRGFAFLVYSLPDSCNKAIEANDHQINGKPLDVQKAKVRQGKIFVGGITRNITEDDVRSYFGQFGNVVNIEWPFDKVKNQRKGYCFVVFDNDRVANNILRTPKHTIGEKEVDVKRAVQNNEKQQNTLTNNTAGGWGTNNPGFYQNGNQYLNGSNFNYYGPFLPVYNCFPSVAEGAKPKGRGGFRQARQQPY